MKLVDLALKRKDLFLYLFNGLFMVAFARAERIAGGEDGGKRCTSERLDEGLFGPVEFKETIEEWLCREGRKLSTAVGTPAEEAVTSGNNDMIKTARDRGGLTPEVDALGR